MADAHDIDRMVQRFLWWTLPKTFNPDCGIQFDGRKADTLNASRQWPVGTNLFTAEEAKAMVLHMLADAQTDTAPGVDVAEDMGSKVRVLLHTLKGGIERGDLKLSGSDDMCQFAVTALTDLEIALRAFEGRAKK